MKFQSNEYAEIFVRQHEGQNDFPNRFQIIWINICQNPKERANFQRNLAPLFKVKRAICELKNIDGSKIVISKINKKVLLILF